MPKRAEDEHDATSSASVQKDWAIVVWDRSAGNRQWDAWLSSKTLLTHHAWGTLPKDCVKRTWIYERASKCGGSDCVGCQASSAEG